MDDAAIWSQNWSWRPSPARGHITKASSICTLCDGGCGIQGRLVDKKRIIGIEGNPAHPVNMGGVCPLCAAGAQFVYAPYRITQPLKQTKKRGDVTGFQPVAWNDAIAELGARLAKLRTDGKPQSAACITGQRRSSMDDLWRQFFTAYGSPNLYTMPSPADSNKLAATLTTGKSASFAFALERASYVLCFGAGMAEDSCAPSRMQAAFRQWRGAAAGKNPVKIVQVESRCSLSASKADQFLAVAPGGEAALAMAIANVMIKENLYDADFVGKNVFGFEDWTDAQGKTRQGFKNYALSAVNAPEEISKRVGLDASRIRDVAREFARQKGAVAVWGEQSAGLAGNIYHDLVFLALNVLKGNPGGDGLVALVPEVPLGALPQVNPDATAQQGLQKKISQPQPGKMPLPGNGLYVFLDAVASGASYPVDVLMIHEANPAYSLPETKLFKDALAKTGMLVSFSSYMDETAQQADLILPNHVAFERFDDAIGIEGAPFAYYAVAAPVIEPQCNTKHTGEILLEVGKSVGGNVGAAVPWSSYQDYLKSRVKELAAAKQGALAEKPDVALWQLKPGQSPSGSLGDAAALWKKLVGGACWYDAPADTLQGLATPSGKLELACQSLQAKGGAGMDDLAFLPHFAQIAPSGDPKQFPLLMVTYKSTSLSDGYLPTPPFMMKTVFDFVLKGTDLFVEVNPQDAAALGLGDGEQATLSTTQGDLPVRVRLYAGARPGVVYMARGLGHKAYDQYIQDKGVNANQAIEVQMDPVTGLGTVWATRAQLRRA
ncbi:MAG: molybdopterin-dependent oxidoreductase [Syntrophobacteraceae bacterium]|nr:molybdopterin-dependent oxidoreductase [Desulfobacteraceae bacterium]